MKIKPGQIISLKTALNEVSGMVDEAHIYIVNALITHREITSLEDLTRGEWEYLRDNLYPNWRTEDWTLDAQAKAALADLLAGYREKVTGQLRLF